MKIRMVVQAGGAIVVGGAVVAVMVAHPATLLAKCTYALVFSVVGANATAKLQKDIENLTESLAELKAKEVSAAAG